MSNSKILPLAILVLSSALLFGGGTKHGLVSDSIPQILSILLLAYAVFPALRKMTPSPLHWVILFAGIVLPLAQLIPLPASIWLALPGRDQIVEMYHALNIDAGVLSLSLRPSETWRSLMAVMPALALGLAVIILDLRSRALLLLVMIAFAAINILFGLAQMIGGTGSNLYFYEITNRGRAVGLFANANHYTAYLYAVIPFVCALFSGSSSRIAPARNVIMGGLLALLLVGLSISGSRTAVILGLSALLFSLLFIANKTVATLLEKKSGRLMAFIGLATILPVMIGVGLFQIFARIQTEDPFSDLRYQLYQPLFKLALQYMPFGSGFGSFERVYQWNEPVTTVIPAFVNHAHNDYLELVIEGGLPTLFFMILVLLFLVRQTALIFYSNSLIENRIEKAAIVSIWLLLVHSAWDYPLRTIGVSALFGIALGSLIKPNHVNVETIADIARHLRQMKFIEWVEGRSHSKRRPRGQRRLSPELPVQNF